MIDDEQGDFAFLLLSNGGGWICLIIAIVVSGVIYAIAASNARDCAKETCPTGQTSRLLDHDCVCVSTPTTP